ncbi:uncharacterized protein F5147DRAFT_579826 [Suillus discolor]|uniref:Uncharacterized protein n=1 Tax=Suillus discolor TaxID=1912936 RepID=A0A9P7JSD5_9AGAM|nr:uncharacterized protein F5147DRAFT_579826 [Suillus discolor]KAG2104741.1 hypothetical protein F5147DRAFT_579826 [Suillus discolor]
MIVGGMMQFLAKAQGMPKHIEAALVKTTRNFIWNDARSPPMNLEQLYQPKETRGINLLDIKSRNEAIKMTWVKSYLNISPTRPTWAYVLDLLINNLKTKDINNGKRVDNTFLQNWDPPTRGHNSRSLPNEALKIIKTTKKHNIVFTPIKMSKNIKKQLPAWHNIGAPQNMYHKTKNKCLQETHNVQNIKNLIKCRKRLTRLRGDLLHVSRKTCACSNCKRDRNKGCKNPYYCAQIATKS